MSLINRPPPRPKVGPTSDDPLDPVLEHLARLMDGIFQIPGTNIRVGLDALIGLIPGLGDAITTFVSLYIVAAASKLGVPRITLARMGLNIAIDSLCGAIPFLGDVFDIFWKANFKNVELIRRNRTAAPQEVRRGRIGDWLFLMTVMAIVIGVLGGAIAVAYLLVKSIAGLFAGG